MIKKQRPQKRKKADQTPDDIEKFNKHERLLNGIEAKAKKEKEKLRDEIADLSQIELEELNRITTCEDIYKLSRAADFGIKPNPFSRAARTIKLKPMTTKTETHLIIKMDHGSPEELRMNLIKAIAAAQRYYAQSSDKRKEDGDYMYELSDLQQALATT